MSKILIIGNGFDIAHGLPTKYENFLDYVRDFNHIYDSYERNSNILFRDGKYNKSLLKLFKSQEQRTQNIIEEFRKLTQDNIWLRHFRIVMASKGETWIDFEKEISTVVKNLKKYFSNDEAFSTEMEVFKQDIILIKEKKGGENSLIDFEKLATERYQQQLDYLIRAFEIYLCIYVNDLPIMTQNSDILALNLCKDDAVISFNYTDTYNRVYTNNRVDNVHYIHGVASVTSTLNSNTMVIGIDDIDLTTYKDENQFVDDTNYIGFKKYFQRIVKGTDSTYKKHFFNGGSEPIDVFFFGHSMDVTDKDILKEIILHERTRVTIFSYNKESQKKHVNNLVKLLGSKEVIANTYDFHPKIKFVIQEKEETN